MHIAKLANQTNYSKIEFEVQKSSKKSKIELVLQKWN
jgi:hypothetical protein